MWSFIEWECCWSCREMDLRDAVVIGIGIVVMLLLSDLQGVVGIRFVMDREDCFSHDVQYEGDTVHVSFVVIKADASWHYAEDGVDLVVSLFFSFAAVIFVWIESNLWKSYQFFSNGERYFPGNDASCMFGYCEFFWIWWRVCLGLEFCSFMRWLFAAIFGHSYGFVYWSQPLYEEFLLELSYQYWYYEL